MFEEIKERVCLANKNLPQLGLVCWTWGNVSEVTPDRHYLVIKPSGVEYDDMSPTDMVVVRMSDGAVVEGNLRASTDTPTHIELYKKFPQVGGITHTHSINATAFAQANVSVPALGTTHADYFHGAIPCTRGLRPDEVNDGYEFHTGQVIVETFREHKISPDEIPGVLVANHGVFAWGKDALESVYHASALEIVAETALKTLFLNKQSRLSQSILDKHYSRKHGKGAYYGQGEK